MVIRVTENIPEVGIFKEGILQDQSLTSLLPAAIYAIQREWIELEKSNVKLGSPLNMNLYNLLQKPLQKQKELIEDLAKTIFFSKTTVKYEKKCGEKGHTIRLNAEKLNLQKAKKLIEKTRSLYEKDPSILKVRCYEEQNPRRRRKYDVRVDFRHVDNCPACCYLPEKIVTTEKISALSVIELFKQSVKKNGLDLDEQYSKLIHLTFRMGLCSRIYIRGHLIDILKELEILAEENKKQTEGVQNAC